MALRFDISRLRWPATWACIALLALYVITAPGVLFAHTGQFGPLGFWEIGCGAGTVAIHFVRQVTGNAMWSGAGCELWPQDSLTWLPSCHISGNGFHFELPFWIPLLLIAAVAAFAWIRPPRSEPGRCGRCGYDLTGNVSGRCPECGTDIRGTPGGAPAAAPQPTYRRLFARVALFILIYFALRLHCLFLVETGNEATGMIRCVATDVAERILIALTAPTDSLYRALGVNAPEIWAKLALGAASPLAYALILETIWEILRGAGQSARKPALHMLLSALVVLVGVILWVVRPQ